MLNDTERSIRIALTRVVCLIASWALRATTKKRYNQHIGLRITWHDEEREKRDSVQDTDVKEDQQYSMLRRGGTDRKEAWDETELPVGVGRLRSVKDC